MSKSKLVMYGMTWPEGAHPAQIEIYCIKKGGEWIDSKGNKVGLGLVHHYEQLRKILWPELDSHRWHVLCLNEIRRPKAKVTVLMGPGSCGKTHEAACNYLMEYYCHPNETCLLVSSTDLRGLELRVWGEIKSLHERAKRFDFIPGNLIDSKHAISTDDIEEDGVRDLRAGVIAIPTVQGGKNVGLGKWVGIKQKRLRLVADESSLMSISFLNAFANLDKNEDFQAIVLGNPIDFNDPLGKAAEPKDGWAGHMEPKKTECWDTRFMNGRCVNLVGTDSPNNDFPENEPTRYKYLISREKIANTLSFFPENSIEYYSQCIGVMKVAGMERRVLTRDIIRKYGADKDTAFKLNTTKIYFVDAARGGDKCIGGDAEFGPDVNGNIVLRFGTPKVIPIVVGSGTDAEYQIANFVKQDCTALNVPPENMGHDATGWGSLGTALAVVWSNQTIPVESGGSPSSRPVNNDMYITDDSETPPKKRLKLCNEHYDKKVTEFWFSMRYATESSQLRNLPDEAVEDLIERKWDYTRGNKITIESKSTRMDASGTRKPGMKERIGRSPDYGDWACGILEMARRRGFQIAKLGKDISTSAAGSNHLQKLHEKHQAMLNRRQLQNA